MRNVYEKKIKKMYVKKNLKKMCSLLEAETNTYLE